MSAPEPIPAFARGLCDDAAVFPPGLAPLSEAVPAHLAHRTAGYRDLVGPLVLAEPMLSDLAPLLTGDTLDVAVTAPSGPGQVAQALAATRGLPVRVAAFEVAVPEGTDVAAFLDALADAGSGAANVPIHVEVPRDDRRTDVIAALAGHGYRAKFRTGGVRADLYPDEAELAASVRAVAAAGVPFKATAGLHHAVRNTDPDTGFEQHGFLNVLLATDAALGGGGEADVAAVLAERDADTVASRVRDLGPRRTAAARESFVSFGTCSITEPLTELVDLGLVDGSVVRGEGATT